ncbi:[FeFe] hydrogenase H-cluster maturation GTPase HydF [Chitinispirillales bacterium ANBcel5]|uniref:[FeFe] hydrogenase H-cluster maturation GTPase HydF n=1 Tax=Cellulosispirillum alkaliphilum TaxID=3039283 RepID=UPI002A4FD17E|nr:[FeFe] hydrogenase H-cluster maturation GTPase HydF [Chitinispirillales bacterium ANBcel5]
MEMMQKAPKSMRLQIGLFGRTNVGKSSFLNMISGQDVSITSPQPGTTTDVVEKAMELLPLGPVLFLDTAGVDDSSQLSEKRIKRTKAVFERADVFVLIVENGIWGRYEQLVSEESNKHKVPLIIIVNKSDIKPVADNYICSVKRITKYICITSCKKDEERSEYVNSFKERLVECLPEEYLNPPALIGDLIPPGGVSVLIIPIDLQAPKGRLILPQVQTMRDALDNNSTVIVVKENEYQNTFCLLSRKPDLVVCDSQVVMKMVAETPQDILCTTFSILFARYKSDLITAAKGAAQIDRLKPGDKVLIAEACTHHATKDDIGRVKIPGWLRQHTGFNLDIDVCSGRDFPSNLKEYSLVIHCGGCMFSRKEVLTRFSKAQYWGVPITNYGVAISCLQGVIKRVLKPFPAALEAYESL